MTINDRCTKVVFIRRLTGKEFARHKEIAKVLDVQFFFARPYHSWERGANENTNGLARQYIPIWLTCKVPCLSYPKIL